MGQGSVWQFQVLESINSLPLSLCILSFWCPSSEGFLVLLQKHKEEVHKEEVHLHLNPPAPVRLVTQEPVSILMICLLSGLQCLSFAIQQDWNQRRWHSFSMRNNLSLPEVRKGKERPENNKRQHQQDIIHRSLVPKVAYTQREKHSV